jgi:pimeloyl-ACP methyl ester carboxylesterase
MDCRGRGKSAIPDGENRYGRHMVDDVVRLLDHFGLREAHLVGHSLGGRIALKFTALYPNRVKSLVLIGTGGSRTTDDHSTWDTMAESLRRGEGIAPVAWQMWPTDQPAPSEEQLNAINERFLAGNDPALLAATALQIKELGTTQEEVQALQSPILAAVGSVDRFRPEVEALKELQPKMQIVIVEGASHGNILERSELKEAIRSFLGK